MQLLVGPAGMLTAPVPDNRHVIPRPVELNPIPLLTFRFLLRSCFLLSLRRRKEDEIGNNMDSAPFSSILSNSSDFPHPKQIPFAPNPNPNSDLDFFFKLKKAAFEEKKSKAFNQSSLLLQHKTHCSSSIHATAAAAAMDADDNTLLRRTLAFAAPFLFSFLALLIALEQLAYFRKKRSLPGRHFLLPFLGNVVSVIRDPTRFWELQAALAKSSPFQLSTNYLFGNFVLFIRSSELSHRVFTNVSPDAFQVIGHPFGKKLFGEHNLIYMFGQEHKEVRRRIAPNFTVKALSTYISLQQRIIVEHLKAWEQLSSSRGPMTTPIALRLLCRDLNLETSQTVFAGPYLNAEERTEFNKNYNLFNVGLMKIPVDLPGFAFRNARLAVDRLVQTLIGCVVASKERMSSGAEPCCLIDFWMEDTLRELAAASEAGAPPPPYTSDVKIASYLFDFLFAAQDASTSSLLWAVALLESHPDVLARVREEVAGIWSPESDALITQEQLKEMKYTEAVAREVVRFRPPATLVPHIAQRDFRLTESYTVPKGTIVFPSLFESSFQGFSEADRFDPDRFMPGRLEDRLFRRNFLVFGAGPHQCVGQRYALNHLALFIALFASILDFKRHRTDGCDDISYVPTIAPKDDCAVYLSRRCARYPSF
ncbi:hypothetical protein ACLOJK_008477 [Asimina triloba]